MAKTIQEEIKEKVVDLIFYGKNESCKKSFKMISNGKVDLYCWANKESGDVEVMLGSKHVMIYRNSKYPVFRRGKWIDKINEKYKILREDKKNQCARLF